MFGEVGLSGEVRHVAHADKRLAEAKKLGFDGAIGPQSRTGKKLTGLHGVNDVRGALNKFLEKD
ncbi:DNA repair protein RadA [compost metagenome]